MWSVLLEDLPTQIERAFMAVGATLGAIFGALFGDHVEMFYWLFGFISIDYITGLIAACITQTVSSEIGFRGIIKKSIIILICLLFHGLDQITHWDWIGSAVIVAFCVNETVSVLENVDRAGFGNILPPLVRNVLETVKKQQEETMKRKLNV